VAGQRSDFHKQGRHVQKAHGRRATMAADGSHLSGGMIALMPTAADAKRLALAGGEASADLHLTLMFLGDDGSAFDHDARNLIVDSLRPIAQSLDPLTLKIFGVAHWNGNTASASWVWNVGDQKDPEALDPAPCVDEIQDLVEDTVEILDLGVPEQHSPWCAHICAAYTKDVTLVKELEKRLGVVTFDRIRVTFGQDATDIPLTKAITAAAAPLRRQPFQWEIDSKWDWVAHQRDWESATDGAMTEYAAVLATWRQQISDQIVAAGNHPAKLANLDVSTLECSRMLTRRMTDLAERSGKAQQREAEQQGVEVPAWDLNGELVASLSGMGTITSVSNVTAAVMGSNVVQSAKRFAQRLFGVKSGKKLASEVDAHLLTLTDAQPRDLIKGAMTSAQHTGRLAVLSVITEPGIYFASEALDQNTCKPCKNIDGSEFESLSAAREAYPGGGYTLCQGGARCRGELITVWGGRTASAEGKATMPETLGGKPNPATGKDKRLHENDAAADVLDDCPDGDCPDAEMGGKPNPGTGKDKRLHENPKATVEVPKTLEEAVEEALAAKAAAVVEVPTAAQVLASTAPWRGPICVEAQVTGDGREFAADALTWQDPPIPLRWNKEDSHGGEPHTVAVNVGRIDRIWRDNGLIMAEGVLNLAEQDGQRVHDMIKGEFIRGVSIDADSITGADIEYVWPEDVNAGSGEGEDDLLKMLFAQPEKVVYHAGRIRAATLCDIPAFAEAYIELLDGDGAVVAGGQRHPELVKYTQPRVPALDGLLAAGGPREENWQPPLEWFLDPKLSAPTTIQVTDDGRVYGHAAQWGSCHIGQPDTCVQPPYEDSHPYYMTGEVSTRDGKRVAVGQITVGTGHAPLGMGAVPATEHYDHTGHAVADVTVGNDAHGIWVAGSIRPGAEEHLVHALRAAGAVSGDWRRIGSSLRLVGLLAVNIPGFPIPKMRARVASAASGDLQQEALVAAGKLTTVHALSEREVVQHAFALVMDKLFEQVHEGR
jgi:2'-5' RNA ligase